MSEKMRQALVDCGAILYGDFILASGRKSRYYVDIKKASTDPKVLRSIAKEMAQEIKDSSLHVDRIAGVVLGSIPLAVALSLETGIPFIMVRKEKKDHGTAKLIEGPFQPGEDVLVVEDVVTSAGSALFAIELLRQEGMVVKNLFSVVDREEGGRQRLSEIGIQLSALVTATEVLGK
jgi:orotate phosphoribosyltransferase